MEMVCCFSLMESYFTFIRRHVFEIPITNCIPRERAVADCPLNCDGHSGQPVCGSDGNIYANACELKMLNCGWVASCNCDSSIFLIWRNSLENWKRRTCMYACMLFQCLCFHKLILKPLHYKNNLKSRWSQKEHVPTSRIQRFIVMLYLKKISVCTCKSFRIDIFTRSDFLCNIESEYNYFF